MIFTRSTTTSTPTPRTPPTMECLGTHAGTQCPLQGTQVTAGVAGFVAEVRVEQTYVNPHDVNLDTLYTFPLPHDAAVVAFEFVVDGKVVHGVVREREEAREKFQQARTAGKRAGLVEQQRPNVFTLELANIPARAVVKATLTYLEALPYRSGTFELRFPTVVAPRYTPQGETSAEPVQAPRAAAGQAGHTFAMDITVDAGMPIEAWHCATHALALQPAAANQLRLKLDPTAPDRDLVLTYKVGGAGVKLGLLTYRPDPTQDGTFYMFAVPPADVGTADVRAKELVFLLDRSGSMGGPKMTKAREALIGCLRALNPADTFAIYAFDDQCESFAHAPVTFTQAQLEHAERWLGHVNARGGTEMLTPLTQVLALAPDRQRQRVVVLITDGQVSNETQLIALVRQKLGAARLYTVGIDTAVNTHLLTKLAQMGKGSAEFALPTGDIEGCISALANRFSSPLLTDPVADFGTVRVSDLAPHPLPDVMAGRVVAVAGRFRGKGQTDVTFSGQGVGQLLEHRVEVDFPAQDRSNPVVEKIWARMMIDRHEDNLLDDPNAATLKQKIVALSVQHGLISSLTSFVAIDERDGDPKKAREAVTQTVPVAVPAGWDQAQFASMAAAPAARSRVATLSACVSEPRAKAFRADAPARLFGDLQPSQAPAGASFDSLDTLNADLAGPLSGLKDRSSQYELAGSSLEASFDAADELVDPACDTRKSAYISGPSIDPMDALRKLAKLQRVDGSWDGSVIETTRALAQFIAEGHTDRTGEFTAQVRRAIEYIDRALTDGWSGDTRELASTLAMLAGLTGSQAHRALRDRVH